MDPSERHTPSVLPPRTCDICGEDVGQLYPTFSGGDILALCDDCKGEVAGGE